MSAKGNRHPKGVSTSFNVNFPPHIAEKLKLRCELEGLTISAYIRHVVTLDLTRRT